MKCALISSGTGGLKEASGDNAVYLDEVSGASIFNSIKSLIDNPNKMVELSNYGHDFVVNNHNIKIRSEQIMKLRHNIIKIYK